VERHVEHALALAGCLEAVPGARWLDLGSGGGAPGLVLAVAVPETRLVLLDAGKRRCQFLREAVAELSFGDRVTVVEDRAESAAREQELRETFDVVVARSFGAPAVSAECAVGFLRLGGRLVVSEPPEGGETGRWPAEGLDELGFGAAESCGVEDASFVRLEKLRIEERWPRRVGIPEKRPLW
jgi:16S rRNA (guanine527-N7)-methyltransferase